MVPHYHGTHSQAWFLEQAIRNSGHYHPDLEEADIVYVDDYCYYSKWLAHVHTVLTVRSDFDNTPGDVLVALYDKMLATPRWQRNWGADYVFFDGHSGFQFGKAGPPYDAKVSFAQSALFVTVS